MKGAFNRDDALPPGGTEREQQRVLVRLGAAVDEEDSREAGRRERGEARGGEVADCERQRVALEHERRGLRLERGKETRMRVPEQRHSVAAPEVEHAAAAS